MPASRLGLFIILSIILHAAVFSAVFLLSPVEPDEPARPLMVGVTTRNSDPGKGKGNNLDPAPLREPAPERKVEKPVENKTVKKTVSKKPVQRQKTDVINRDNVPVSDNTTVTSAVTSEDNEETASVSPDGRGKGTGIGDGGTGLDTYGSGMGTETGYPDYGVNPKPDYPRIAKRHGYEGLVTLNVFVTESGSVGKVELKHSSGYDVLDNSALDAVKKWTFIPGKKNGRPVSSWVIVPIRFDLTNG